MASRAFCLLKFFSYLADTESLASTTMKETMVLERFFVEVMAFEAAFFLVFTAVKAKPLVREASASKTSATSKASAATKTTVATKASMSSEASLFDRTASYLRCCCCCD
ncbi:MAG: hypothetical protein ABJ034_07705 [Hyphomicrobiales bacterium]